ncbi:MAG TPA: hypothetical protein VFC07_11300 [Verrucomicrobiae bacterium]|nr:hypothetical protein [Verrucomicrobiae bacterium]
MKASFDFALFRFVTVFLMVLNSGPFSNVGGAQTNTGDKAGLEAVSTDIFLTFAPQEMNHTVTPEKIAEAKRSKECRPAAQDPEGNWGPVVEGFQLSVRFEKESYKIGEPVTATVLIRDAVQKRVFYRDFEFDPRGVRTDSPLCNLSVLDEQQKRVPRLQKEPQDVADGPHRPRVLNPGTQHKYEIKLDGRFNLTQPGKYFISAKRQVHKLSGDGYSEITSGVATIKLATAQP